MFKVKVKSKYVNGWEYQKPYYNVYNVRDDKTGFPQFLIYQDFNRGSAWVWKSAKYFEPVENIIAL